MIFTFRCCLLTFVALFLFGCSGDGLAYKVVPFEGTITYKGQPLQDIVLEFTVEGHRSSTAFVGAGGSFRAVHTPETVGIPVGKCTLVVHWAHGSDPPFPLEYTELFAKYGTDSPGFVFEVTKAERDFKINLE